MTIFTSGDTGPTIELLQSTLKQAGHYLAAINGVYDDATAQAVSRFQTDNGLIPNGRADQGVWNALAPYLNGYDTYTVLPGDSVYQIATHYNLPEALIMTANPGINTGGLRPGQRLILPFGDIVPTDISYTSRILELNLESLAMLYPFLEFGHIGFSVLHQPLHYIKLGRGKRQLFYCASYHANEWINTPVLMKFLEEFCRAYASGGTVFGYPAQEIFESATIHIVPMVNPDGVDLVTGAFAQGSAPWLKAKAIGDRYPAVPFPDGWKANIDGIDLNLQYPAGWEQARESKALLGITAPAPRDFVGFAPLTADEAKAVYDFTLEQQFQLILTYHSQGNVIYWKFADFQPEHAYEIGVEFARVSGYLLEDTPYASSFAGYKDWFIQQYNRPGYTIETGSGVNPLPISQFPDIYNANLGILVLAAVLPL